MKMRTRLLNLLAIMILTGCSFIPGQREGAAPAEDREAEQGLALESSEDASDAAKLGGTSEANTGETGDTTNSTGSVPGMQFDLPQISRFAVESGTPAYLPAFMHTEQGCNWMGVGGQVFDVDGQPIIDLVVLLQGFLSDEPVNLFALTGTATAFGPGGYEFMLANTIVPSEQSLYVSLYDSYGNKLSDDIYFDTLELCESNLVLINFREYIFEGKFATFLPFVGK